MITGADHGQTPRKAAAGDTPARREGAANGARTSSTASVARDAGSQPLILQLYAKYLKLERTALGKK